MPLRSKRLTSLLDRAAFRLGYVPYEVSPPLLKGRVFVRPEGQEEVCLGDNVLTRKMRVNAAGLLARRASDWGFPVVYDGGIEGYAATVDDVFPCYIAVGTSTISATAADTTMGAPLLKAGAVAYYPLEKILFRRDPDAYPADIPISASFFFNIPAGEVYDGVGGTVDFQEFALFGANAPAVLPGLTDPVADNDMLARKVRRHAHDTDVDLVVRWEIST